jgi:hypothetical protein
MAGLSAALLLASAILRLASPPGLDFLHRNSPTSQKYVIETMSGGVALLDYNGDGRLDIFLVNGGKLDDPVRLPVRFARSAPAYWNRLYRQNADGSFTDVTREAGLWRAGEENYGMGAIAGDYNNDGFADLYVTNYGRNQLYRNNGDGSFTDVTAEAGVAAGGWSVSAAFLDYDNDGLLDLFVSRYLDYDLGRNVLCGAPFLAYCRPDKYRGVTNVLYRNLGQGRFADVSKSAKIAAAVGKGMGVGVLDFDDDGWADIFVSNDGMEQFLFHNERDGTFREVAFETGVALGEGGRSYAGMAVAIGDYDNDGRCDVLVTNLALEKWALYHNEGGGQFRYASLETGLAGLTARNSGWGAGFRDFDNDGWKDLFVAQSHVLDNVERIHSGLRYREPPTLLRNEGGRFRRLELGQVPVVAGRGAAFGDLNNDGGIDVVVSVLGDRPLVFFNEGGANHWLLLKLVGARSNRDGMGARVRVGRQRVYATTSGSYLSSSDPRVHIGLGSEIHATGEVLWPSGQKQILEDVAADRVVEIREPDGSGR